MKCILRSENNLFGFRGRRGERLLTFSRVGSVLGWCWSISFDKENFYFHFLRLTRLCSDFSD